MTIIVDTHCHASLDWYEPIEALLYEMDANEVEQAVLIQIQGQFDNEYQLDCARRHAGRFGVVVLVDTQRTDAVQELERLAERGVHGVRLRPTTRSPGEDPLAIWRAAERLGLVVSCGGDSAEFASDMFADTIQALPRLRVVIEHLGGLSRPDPDDAALAVRRSVFALARFPNVSIKVPGLGEFARRAMPVRGGFPFVEPIPLLLDEAYAAFGPRRMMWGSDFPPVAGREGYRNALRLTLGQFRARDQTERDLIFGGSAVALFGLR